jgi:hypothetical protein
LLVEQCLGCAALGRASFQEREYFAGVCDDLLLQASDEHSALAILHKRQGLLLLLFESSLGYLFRGKQVGDLLVVELQERDLDTVLGVLSLQGVENLLHRPGYDPGICRQLAPWSALQASHRQLGKQTVGE